MCVIITSYSTVPHIFCSYAQSALINKILCIDQWKEVSNIYIHIYAYTVCIGYGSVYQKQHQVYLSVFTYLDNEVQVYRF